MEVGIGCSWGKEVGVGGRGGDKRWMDWAIRNWGLSVRLELGVRHWMKVEGKDVVGGVE